MSDWHSLMCYMPGPWTSWYIFTWTQGSFISIYDWGSQGGTGKSRIGTTTIQYLHGHPWGSHTPPSSHILCFGFWYIFSPIPLGSYLTCMMFSFFSPNFLLSSQHIPYSLVSLVSSLYTLYPASSSPQMFQITFFLSFVACLMQTRYWVRPRRQE